MKRLLALALAVILTLSLCACGSSGSDNNTSTTSLQVGYGKVDITPTFPVGMGGYSDYATRRVEGFITYLYATCIAMTEGDETILAYTIDIAALGGDIQDELRQMISTSLDIPKDHIFLGATHTHNAPVYTNTDADGAKYQTLLKGALVEAGKKALEDRSGATINATTTVIEGMNFIRHYLLTTGSYAGPNFGGSYDNNNIVDHAYESDPEMTLIQFDREGDKKDVLMVNWQAHPASGKNQIDYTSACADFVGPLRDKVEADSGMLVAYFTGASGDLVTESFMTSKAHKLTWRQYGEKLAEKAVEALPQLKAVEGSGITTSYVEYAAPVDHSWDHMLAQANEVYTMWETMGRTAGDALASKYGFSSAYQAKFITIRSGMGETTPMQMNAFRVGGIGFITGTYEMSSCHGEYIKDNSPFEFTFLITGNSTYVPRTEAYDYRSYEGDTTLYAQGTGEDMAKEYVEMLKGVAPSA